MSYKENHEEDGENVYRKLEELYDNALTNQTTWYEKKKERIVNIYNFKEIFIKSQ